MGFLTAREISKSYRDDTALNNVSFSGDEGKITGLIGPDGAGKSSLMKIILGLVPADSGALFLHDNKETDYLNPENRRVQREYIRENVGYMPEVFSLYIDLSVEENLRFAHRIHRGDPSDYDALSKRLYRFNRLKEFSDTRAGALSGGMKQKLALSCALMHSPKLLILDEPTTGVDPLSRREFWAMLKELKERGITIVVSTPYMEEAVMCDSVSLLHNGSVLARGTPNALITSFPGVLMETESDSGSPQDVRFRVQELLPSCFAYLAGRKVRLFFSSGSVSSGQKTRDLGVLSENGVPHWKEVQPGLEDLFVVKVLMEKTRD